MPSLIINNNTGTVSDICKVSCEAQKTTACTKPRANIPEEKNLTRWNLDQRGTSGPGSEPLPLRDKRHNADSEMTGNYRESECVSQGP